MDEQLKLARIVVDVVLRAKKIRFDSAVVQCWQTHEFVCASRFLWEKEKEEKKFQQTVYQQFKFEKIISFDVRVSVNNKVITYEPNRPFL